MTEEEKIQDIVQRYQQEATFKDRMDKDPLATLQAECVAQEDVSTVLSLLDIETEVPGYVQLFFKDIEE